MCQLAKCISYNETAGPVLFLSVIAGRSPGHDGRGCACLRFHAPKVDRCGRGPIPALRPSNATPQPGSACLSSETAPRALLRRMFDAAVAAATRRAACRPTCRPRRRAAPSWSAPARRPPRWRRRSRPLAGAARRAWSSPATAMALPCKHIEVVEAAHPVPDAAGQQAARAHPGAGRAASRPDDLVLCLISGGGSALLALPAPGLTPGRQAGGQPGAAEIRRHDRAR